METGTFKKGSVYLNISFNLDEGDPGDRLTAPVKPSAEIIDVRFENVDVTTLLNEANPEYIPELEEQILRELELVV